jgi:hypothetical protein
MNTLFKSPVLALYAALEDAVRETNLSAYEIDLNSVSIHEQMIVCTSGIGIRIFVELFLNGVSYTGNADFYNE